MCNCGAANNYYWHSIGIHKSNNSKSVFVVFVFDDEKWLMSSSSFAVDHNRHGLSYPEVNGHLYLYTCQRARKQWYSVGFFGLQWYIINCIIDYKIENNCHFNSIVCLYEPYFPINMTRSYRMFFIILINCNCTKERQDWNKVKWMSL